MTLRACRVSTASDGVPEELLALQMAIFPEDDEVYPSDGYWWMVRDGREPVAFATLRLVPSWQGSGYLARCGVLAGYRGRGLQRRLLAARERLARQIGLARLLTTTLNNPVSANNLIRLKSRKALTA